jgi:hypothetical protein
LGDEARPKKPRKQARKATAPATGDANLTPAQMTVNEQMRRALEEDQYSANGSIVDTESDDDENQYVYHGQSIRLDRNYLLQAARKHLWLERVGGGSGAHPNSTGGPDGSNDQDNRRAAKKKRKKGKRGGKEDSLQLGGSAKSSDNDLSGEASGGGHHGDPHEFERDEGSIFGQTTGSSNSTWVECDKCKKVREQYFAYLFIHSIGLIVIVIVIAYGSQLLYVSCIVASSPWSRRRKEAPIQMVLFHEQERRRTLSLFRSRRGIRRFPHTRERRGCSHQETSPCLGPSFAVQRSLRSSSTDSYPWQEAPGYLELQGTLRVGPLLQSVVWQVAHYLANHGCQADCH